MEDGLVAGKIPFKRSPSKVKQHKYAALAEISLFSPTNDSVADREIQILRQLKTAFSSLPTG
jgi:hypothetical protein